MAGTASKTKVLIFAVLLGLVASLLTYRFLRNAQASKAGAEVVVVVPSQDIHPRTIITSSMLESEEIPLSRAPGGAYTRMEEVIGKVALANLAAGVPIKVGDVETKGVTLGLSYVIPKNMRAVTVSVDRVIGVAGFPKPGDHVDIVATFKRGDEAVAMTVMQNVRLLAMGPRIEQERMEQDGKKPSIPERKDTATLLVNPAQAERLVLAENEGKLRLVLRAAGDTRIVMSQGITRQAVTGYAPTRPAASRPAAVTVRREPPPPRPLRNDWAAYNPYSGSDGAPPRDAKTGPPLALSKSGHQIEVIRGTEIERVVVAESGSVL